MEKRQRHFDFSRMHTPRHGPPMVPSHSPNPVVLDLGLHFKMSKLTPRKVKPSQLAKANSNPSVGNSWSPKGGPLSKSHRWQRPMWVCSPAGGGGLGRVSRYGHQGPPRESAGQKPGWSPPGRPGWGKKNNPRRLGGRGSKGTKRQLSEKESQCL